MAAASVSSSVEAGVESVGNRIGWIEQYVGDLDSAFALTVPKQVAIRDRRLGLFNYSLLATVALGALVAFVAAGEHLELQHMNFRTGVYPFARSFSEVAAGGAREERPRLFSEDDLGLTFLDQNAPTITIEPKLFGESQAFHRSSRCTHISPETAEECKWVRDGFEAVSFEVPEFDSFTIFISSFASPLDDPSNTRGIGDAMGFVKRASGERHPIPFSDERSVPAGVVMMQNFWLAMQVRDMLELAGFEYLTCMVSREAMPGKSLLHAVKPGSCVPAEPWRQSRPPLTTNASWTLRAVDDMQELPDDFTFFNATLLRHPQVMLGVFRPALIRDYRFTVNVDWTNACPWSVWQPEALTRCGILSTALGKGPSSYVVSVEMGPNLQSFRPDGSVVFAYGQPPLKKTVSFVAKGHVTVQVRSSVRALCSFSKMLSLLAGYTFLFKACSYVLKFAVVIFSKHRAAYKALITQRSADFSQMEDLTTSCKELIENHGDRFDPKKNKTTPHGLCLARALERLPEKPGAEDVLMVLLAHEQRLNMLDAMDEPNTNEAEKDVFREYLEEKEQELIQRNRAGEKWEPMQRGQAEARGTSRPLLKGCW